MPDSQMQEKDTTAAIASKRMELSREYVQPYVDRFLDNYKHYFLRLIDEAVESDPDAYPFYSQISLPISYQTVETILPRMFSRLPNFSVTTEQQNDQADELALQNLIKYQLNHPYLVDDPVYVRLMTALKETFITGNGWGTVPWYMKDIETTEWQPYHPGMGLNTPDWNNLEKIKYYGQQPQWQLVKVKKRVMDAPVFEHKSVFHVFPDPKKKRVGQLGYIIFEDNMTLDEIMDLVNISPKDYKNIDKLKTLEPVSTGAMSAKTNYDQEIAAMFGSTDFTGRDTTRGQGEFKVWFMKEPTKLSIVVNETLTIRESDNPDADGKLGVFLMKDIPVPGELYAWGEPDPIKKIEDGMTDQINMRNDSVFYDLLRMWQVDPTALVEGEEFIPEPGTIVQVKSAGAITPIDTGNTKPSAYREYSEWENIVQGVTGVTDYATGNAGAGANKTLGGVELLQQAANARFAMKLQLFEQLGLKAMGTMYVQRNMRYFDTPQTVNTEQGKTTITPEQVRRLRGVVHFNVDTGSTESVNQNTEQAKWTAIINSIGKPPFDQLTRPALDEIGRSFLFALRVPNVDEIMAKATNAAGQPQGQGGTFTPDQLKVIVALIQKVQQATGQQQKARESVSMAYKDAPDSIKRQIEAAAGFTPADQVPTTTGATTPSATTTPGAVTPPVTPSDNPLPTDAAQQTPPPPAAQTPTPAQ